MPISESLARRFKPAGFEQPEGSRQNYVKPRAELQEAFREWICYLPSDREVMWGTRMENLYTKAQEILRPVEEIYVGEANSLLVDFEPRNERELNAGIFISACYNKSNEKVIVLDQVDCEILQNLSCIGYRLDGGKFMVNNGKAYLRSFGFRASGIVVNNVNNAGSSCEMSSGLSVNNGKSGCFFGKLSSGIVINNGESGDSFGIGSSGIVLNNGVTNQCFGVRSSGILITLKDIERDEYSGRKPNVFLGPEELNEVPDLKEYLEELCEFTRSLKDEDSVKRFLQRYGLDPKERIEHDVKDLIDGGESRWLRKV